jgi:hypothetical protein
MIAILSYVVATVNEKLHPDQKVGRHRYKASENHAPANRAERRRRGRRRNAG